jgi:hypothetical protein
MMTLQAAVTVDNKNPLASAAATRMMTPTAPTQVVVASRRALDSVAPTKMMTPTAADSPEASAQVVASKAVVNRAAMILMAAATRATLMEVVVTRVAAEINSPAMTIEQ